MTKAFKSKTAANDRAAHFFFSHILFSLFSPPSLLSVFFSLFSLVVVDFARWHSLVHFVELFGIVEAVDFVATTSRAVY